MKATCSSHCRSQYEQPVLHNFISMVASLDDDSPVKITIKVDQKPDNTMLNELKALGMARISDDNVSEKEGSFIIKAEWNKSDMSEENLRNLVTD